MKKINAKGFTLIELLAVITIMGILMVVAIPAVSRTIENSRKDTFINTAKEYVAGAKNMWAADNLQCGAYYSSAVENGTYYIEVNSAADSSAPTLLEQGGKSAWGNRDIKGYIKVKVDEVGSGATATRKISYYPVLVDGIHGVNVAASTSVTELGTPKTGESLVRGDIVMSGATAISVPSGVVTCVEA